LSIRVARIFDSDRVDNRKQ